MKRLLWVGMMALVLLWVAQGVTGGDKGKLQIKDEKVGAGATAKAWAVEFISPPMPLSVSCTAESGATTPPPATTMCSVVTTGVRNRVQQANEKTRTKEAGSG